MNKKHTGLYTDYYELTMCQAYFKNGMAHSPASFDYSFRSAPYGGGYAVFAGLTSLLEMITDYHFDGESCEYLESKGFDTDFIQYLEGFRFRGNVYSVSEGEIVFPFVPLVRVEGNIIESQLIETLLLNVLNFESLIATKASRIKLAAGERTLMDFGLRRSHGLGGIQASKAAIAGGFDMTSNVYSAFRYGLATSGTMAHSWVQAFQDELTAFRVYAETFPENCILLVDTYDTLKSGIPNAIKIGKEMASKGKQLKGIRLDSGNMVKLSKEARKMLDAAKLEYVRIIASNQLDEHSIRHLMDQSAPIDAFGVGTSLSTGKDAGALDGVYKLCSVNGFPSLKFSADPEKASLPGKKDLLRFINDKGMFAADAIGIAGEENISLMHDPFHPQRTISLENLENMSLIKKVLDKGKICAGVKLPAEVSEYCRFRIRLLPEQYLDLKEPGRYPVGISTNLLRLKKELTEMFNVNSD